MLDGWKVLWGMNPLINNSAQPSERHNYIYDGTGRLETDSGIENEAFSFDAEGNIQLASLRSFPFRLQIDDEPIADSRVKVENWPLVFLLPGILLIVLAGLIFLVLQFR